MSYLIYCATRSAHQIIFPVKSENVLTVGNLYFTILKSLLVKHEVERVGADCVGVNLNTECGKY